MHSVSVWASEFGLSLGQVACAEKSNEITAIPELLRLVDIDEQLEGDLANAREHVTTEKAHGREETRTYHQLPAPKSRKGITLWKGLMTIGVVTSLCIRDGKESVEVRYYISSLAMGVTRFAQAVRGHWGIENTCH